MKDVRGTGARALLAPALLGALATWLVAAAGALVVDGGTGLAGAGLGGALVIAFLLVGQVPVAQAAKGRGFLGAALLLVGYLTRVVLLLVAFVLVVVDGTLDRRVVGGTVIAVALGWTAGTVWAWLHWRPPVVDVELPTVPEPVAPPAEIPADEGRRAR